MKNKWLIPVLVFVILVITYIVRGFLQTRITVEMLKEDKIEESVKTSGVLIKDESIHSFSLSGIAEILPKNGDRVANGELIATVYSGTEEGVSEDVKTRLADINKRIEAINSSHSGDAVFMSDATKIESEIADCVNKIIADVSERNTQLISEYKYRLSTLADQKAVAKGEKEGFADELVRLRAEKSVLEAQLGKLENAVMASMPGIFVEGNDGFEEKLNMASVEKLTPGDINEVINREKNGEVTTADEGTFVYKIVDNYSYCVAVNVDDSMTEDLEVGDSVKIRFSDFTKNDCQAFIKYISDKDEKGKRCVVCACNTYVGGLLEKRVVNVDFVKKSMSGYKVKIENLHTVDNSVGIFVKRGAVMRFIPVNIVYNNEDEAIVSAAETNRPIRSYDELVTAAPSYADGKAIVFQ